MKAPAEVTQDFRNHLFFCFKFLGLGEPTLKQYAMAEELQQGVHDFILQAGRGDGKSVINACFVSWRLLLDPNRTQLVLSATADKAIKFVSQVRQILTLVPYMKHLEPQEHDKDSAFGFNVHCRTAISQDLSVTAKGITSQITGLHADDILGDDIEIPENSDTPMAREKLYDRCLELENVRNKKEDATIRFLGTPQSKDSVYDKLAKLYKVIKFPAVMPDKNNPTETENVHSYVLGLELDAGQSTQPERFSDEKLAEIEGKLGPSLFALHYKLDTSNADYKKYPLRLSDLIVIDVDPEVFPEKITWANSQQNKRVPSFGMKGDIVFEPMWISPNFIPYKQTCMFIDPSGRGNDETTVCIASFVNGYVVVHELRGFEGGYDQATLTKICHLINEYEVQQIRYESNYGDGMFGQILIPVVYQNCGHHIAVEEYKVTGAKEKRILSILEPVFAQHKLVFNAKVIKDQETQIQITRLTERRGALKHDDRVDVLSAAVGFWKDLLSVDPDEAIEKNQEEERKQLQKEWLGNKRALGLLKDRISGAILLNGEEVKKNKFGTSILKRQQ
jgi:hypothetical protein